MATKTVEENRNIASVSISEAIELSKWVIENQSAEEAATLLWIGPVGMGKTEGILEVMRSVRACGYNKPLSPIVRHLSQVHPLDMAGVGLDNTARAMYYAKPPLYVELSERPAPRGCFFDEIDRAQPMAQNAMLQFLLSHELNGHVAEDTYIFAAANGWHAQYTYEMDKATASRLVIMHVEPTKDDWMRWAVNNQVDARILIAIEQCPDILNQHQGLSGNDRNKDSNDGAIKVADPRSWKRLSDALKTGLRTDWAAPYVGVHAAKKFEVFAKIQRDFSKEIRQVLEGKSVSLPSTLEKHERDRTLFCIYLAAAGQIKDIPIARNFLRNGSEQLDRERCYITSKLITYNIDSRKLCEDPEIAKMHYEMIEETYGKATKTK